MIDPGHGDAFVLIGAHTAAHAKVLLSELVERDFRGFRGTPWTPPLLVDGLYYLRAPGVLFAAMPKKAPINFAP